MLHVHYNKKEDALLIPTMSFSAVAPTSARFTHMKLNQTLGLSIVLGSTENILPWSPESLELLSVREEGYCSLQ